MKTTIFLAALYLVFGFFACKKGEGDTVQSVSYQQFEFSKSFGFSGTMKSYMMKGGKLYQYSYLPGDTVELSAAQWKIAQPMVNQFPKFLLDAGSSSYTCTDCADMGGIGIRIKDGSGTRSWELASDPAYVPGPVKNYVSLANSVVEQL